MAGDPGQVERLILEVEKLPLDAGVLLPVNTLAGCLGEGRGSPTGPLVGMS